MNKKILFISWLFINFACATVPSSIDRSDISLGQSFTLTIDVSNSNGDPDLSVLNNSFNIYGTSSSSQTNITNGHMNSQKSYIINLAAKSPGQQTIPAIPVGNDKTAPIAINVTPPSASEIALQKSRIFMNAKVNNQSTYMNVPLIYSIKLYYSVNISNVHISNINIKGATIEPLDKGSQYSENIKGTTYQVYEQKLKITPNTPGSLTIPPVNISGISGNDTGFFGMSQPKPFNVASNAININVNPIPNGISPSEWFPAKNVSINESQSITDTTIKLGQPITQTITVEALGIPANSIPEIKFITPNNVNAYPDKTVSNNSFSGTDFVSTKVFKIAYIPTQAGSVVLPETTIKWWDITSNSLKSTVIPGRTYTVLNENGTALNASAAIIKPKLIKSLDLPLTKTNQTNVVNKIWIYLAIVFALLWLITLLVAIILWRKRLRPTPDNSIEKNNKLNNERKAVALIHKACNDHDIKNLNLALIQWAELHWHKKIYTVLDIKDLSVNENLNVLIDKFNETLYRGTNFDNFDALAHEITMMVSSPETEITYGLKALYPK